MTLTSPQCKQILYYIIKNNITICNIIELRNLFELSEDVTSNDIDFLLKDHGRDPIEWTYSRKNTLPPICKDHEDEINLYSPAALKYDITLLGKERDIDLAKKWGLSRERIRQLRIKFGNIPKYKGPNNKKLSKSQIHNWKCNCEICKLVACVRSYVVRNNIEFDEKIKFYKRIANNYIDLYKTDKKEFFNFLKAEAIKERDKIQNNNIGKENDKM